MNATATLTLGAPDRRGRRGLSVGWGASLLVHAAIAAWLLHALAPRAPEAAPGKRLEVRLAPPRAPATPAEPGAVATNAPPRTPARAAPARPAPATRTRAHEPAQPPAPAYATRPAPARATPDTNVPPPAAPADNPAENPAASNAPTESPSAPSAPTVDMAGARAAARLIAREGGKSLVALPARKPVVDPNGDRQVIDPIEAARKPDCKSAYAGAGLLGLIPLAASAVIDTGCKW